jgi:hypothetical protein
MMTLFPHKLRFSAAKEFCFKENILPSLGKLFLELSTKDGRLERISRQWFKEPGRFFFIIFVN